MEKKIYKRQSGNDNAKALSAKGGARRVGSTNNGYSNAKKEIARVKGDAR